MKKLHYLLILILLLSYSCKKNDVSEKEKRKGMLLSQVDNIINMKLNSVNQDDLNFDNEINPYDVVGKIIGKTAYDVMSSIIEKKTDPDSLSFIYANSLKQNLSPEFYNLDTLNIDAFEKTIFNLLIDVYIKEGFDAYIIKSKLLEKAVVTSCYFDDNQKKRVLIYSSSIRHITSVINKLFSDSKSVKIETIEECWKRKLSDLANCHGCFFEKLSCALFWPECLGIKLLDCIVDYIYDLIFE
jgi:hypothetical protein